MRILRVLSLVLLMFPVLSANAAGEENVQRYANSYTIYPSYTHKGNSAWIIHDLKQGDTVKDYLTLENLSSIKGKFRVYFVEGVEDNGKVVTKDESASSDDIGNLVSPHEQIVELSAGEKKQIDFSYAVPRNFKDGKFVGVFYAEPYIDPSVLNSAVNLKTRVGVRMYTNVQAFAPTHFKTQFTQNHKLFLLLSTILLLITFLWNLIHYNSKKSSNRKKSH